MPTLSAYPVISWREVVGGTLTVTANGIAEPLTITDSDVTLGTFGFGSTAGGAAQSDTVAGIFAAALVSHSQITGVVTSFVWTLANAHPQISYVITKLGDNAADAVAWTGTADPADFGFGAGPQSIAGSATPTLSTGQNCAGLWSPPAQAIDDRRRVVQIAHTAWPPHGPAFGAIDVVRWGSHTRRDMMFDYVEAAYVWSARAADSDFAAQAGRGASDPNNVLELLLRAASDGKLLAVFTGNGEFRTSMIVEPEAFDVRSVATDAHGRGRFSAVSLPMVDLGDTTWPPA